mgnify:CR=1 FL=1
MDTAKTINETGRSITDGVDLLKSLMLEDYKRWSNIPEDKTPDECRDSKTCSATLLENLATLRVTSTSRSQLAVVAQLVDSSSTLTTIRSSSLVTSLKLQVGVPQHVTSLEEM